MGTRRERVVIDVDDDLSGPVARMAAEVSAAARELDSLNSSSIRANRNLRITSTVAGKAGDSYKRLSGNVAEVQRSLGATDRSTIAYTRTINDSSRSIDSYSGRLSLLADSLLMIAPAAAPLGGVAAAGVAGLANQLGIAALATGTMVVAFQGVGDALTAVNKAALDPTTANLDAAADAMRNLSPQAQSLVQHLSDLRPVLQGVRDAAGEDMFPGVEKALDSFETLAPRAEDLLRQVGGAAGDIIAGGAESLTTDRWTGFFDFLESEARPVMLDTAATAGSLAHGLAEMWMAFDPLNDDFGGWMRNAAASFDAWATGLDQTQGFEEFVAYVRDNGPQLAETLGAVASAGIDIATALGPLGGASLRGIEVIARLLSQIADSPFGPVLIGGAIGFRVLARASDMFGTVTQSKAVGSVRQLRADLMLMATQGSAAWARTEQGQARYTAAVERTRRTLGGVARGAAGIAGLAVATSGLADDMGLTNTATLALAGSMAGPLGAAAGAAVGVVMDVAAANDNLDASLRRVQQAVDGGGLAQASTELAAMKKADDDNFFNFGDRVSEQTAQAEDQVILLKGAIEALGNETGFAFSSATPSLKELQRAAASVEPAMRDLGYTWGELTDMGYEDFEGAARAISSWSRQADTASDSTREFTAAVQSLQDVLSRRADMRAYQDAIDAARKSMKENGKTLDITTAKGRANQAALDALAAASVKAAEHMKPLRRAEFMRGAREDFIRAAKSMGLSEDAAIRLARRLKLIPPKVATELQIRHEQAMVRVRAIQRLVDRYGITRAQAKAMLNDVASNRITSVQRLINKYGLTRAQATAMVRDEATGKINAIRNSLASLRDKTVTVTTVYTSSGRRYKEFGPSARGNIFDSVAYAGGGLRDPFDRPDAHPPMVSYVERRWGEPETQGEAYIPFADDWRRPRAIELWEETGRRLGVEFERYAAGGIRVRQSGAGAAAGSFRFPTSLTLTGQLDSDFGPAYVEAIARGAARDEIAADNDRRHRDEGAWK